MLKTWETLKEMKVSGGRSASFSGSGHQFGRNHWKQVGNQGFGTRIEVPSANFGGGIAENLAKSLEMVAKAGSWMGSWPKTFLGGGKKTFLAGARGGVNERVSLSLCLFFVCLFVCLSVSVCLFVR